LPPGLEVETVEPASVVGGWQIGVLPTGPMPGLALGLRLLTVRLRPRAQGGRFTIQVAGRQALDPKSRDISIALAHPIGAIATGGRVAVLADPGMTAELAERGAIIGEFRPAPPGVPADWPWPSGRAPAAPPMLWLRHDGSPAELSLRVATHPRTLSESTQLSIRVEGREVEVQQETECSVQFGTLGHLDLTVPAALGSRWQIEGAGAVAELGGGRSDSGDQSVRLKLPADLTGSGKVRFRYRLSLDAKPSPRAPVTLAIPWIRVAGVNSRAPVTATLEAAPGFAIAAADPMWTPANDASGVWTEGRAAIRISGPASGPGSDALLIRVSRKALAELPRLVASRLWLRTVQGPAGELRTMAAYRVERHDESIAVALPADAVLQAVRVGGETVSQVESLGEEEGAGAGVRIALPAETPAGPVTVELDYQVPAERAQSAWSPPQLAEGGIVQRTLWEVRIPWSRALLGVPAGWSDENQWYWDLYVFKRRPWMNPGALAAWVGMGTASAWSGVEAEPRSDDHGYLFGRPGAPSELGVTVTSRALLVAVCSGLVLTVGGLFLLVWRPRAEVLWLVGVALGLAVAALVHPSVTFLVVQSAAFGVLLTLLLALMQRLFERRRPALGPVVYGESSRTPVPAPGSTLNRAANAAAGSDEPTAIRPRPISTVDRAASVPVSAAIDPGGPAGSSRAEASGRGSAGP
jgi:hypothetical protein